MIEINTDSWDHGIGHQLILIRDSLKLYHQGDTGFDLQNLGFCPPLLSLFISKMVWDKGLNFTPNPLASRYLSTISFLKGIDGSEFEDFELYLSGFTTKTYLPLIRFDTNKEPGPSTQRNNLISQVGQMIRRITKVDSNFYSGLSYLLSELTDNIVDHAEFTHGWLAFQFYPKEGFIDLCIGDSGGGVLASYLRYTGPKDYSYIKSDRVAVAEMIKGESTKKLDERGFGFHTSRELLIDGMGGNFTFVSGEALLLDYKLLEFGTYFPGTLAQVRIPISRLKPGFSIYDYVE